MAGNMQIDQSVLNGTLKSLSPIQWVRVDKGDEETVWDELMRAYHYLGYQKMIGQRIKYLVKAGDRIIAAISYNRPVQRVAARDEYMGWNEAERQKNLHYVVSNNRFLILPWIHIRYLASHLLSVSLKLVQQDWEMSFGVRPMLAETFVDVEKYRGTCYKASNWIYVGETKGFGKVGKRYTYHGNKKAVYLYELDHAYRKKLGCPSLGTKRVDPSIQQQREERRMFLGIPDWDERILEACGLNEGSVQELPNRLETYLNGYRNLCYNGRQLDLINVFIKGLFSDLERKSIEPIALRYHENTGVRNLQMFFKQCKISQEQMVQRHQEYATALLAEPNGMITIDGSDFPKKGDDSVGVTRQHCGILGKTDNCQAGVFIGYSGSRGYTLLDRRLYMPQKWFEEEFRARWKACEVPTDLTFKTKNELATDMLKNLPKETPYRWIGCDSAFGSDRNFLANLPEHAYYFADVQQRQLVFLEMPTMEIPPAKRGRACQYPRPSVGPVSLESIAANDRVPWKTIVLAEGSKGPIVTKTKCLRVVRAQIDKGGRNCAMPLDEVWLYIREYENKRIKYSLSNAPADMARSELDRAATMRWPIEQCFNECKGYLGMDHYESRSWKAWHMHMLLVLIAHLFTVMLRQQFKSLDNIPVLTMPMVKKLVGASLTNSLISIKNALRHIQYHLKKHSVSYFSRRKKRLLEHSIAILT
jgi:SRSO17 transposase